MYKEIHCPFCGSTDIYEYEEGFNYKKWYCGHFHINKTIDKMIFLFDERHPSPMSRRA